MLCFSGKGCSEFPKKVHYSNGISTSYLSYHNIPFYALYEIPSLPYLYFRKMDSNFLIARHKSSTARIGGRFIPSWYYNTTKGQGPKKRPCPWNLTTYLISVCTDFEIVSLQFNLCATYALLVLRTHFQHTSAHLRTSKPL